jgi:hypothetical protein
MKDYKLKREARLRITESGNGRRHNYQHLEGSFGD